MTTISDTTHTPTASIDRNSAEFAEELRMIFWFAILDFEIAVGRRAA